MKKYNNINIKEAKSFKDRLLGLMFKKNINEGLLFNNCKSIHTFFMKEEIDIICTDENDNIIKTYKEVKPNKIIIAPKGTKRIYELPKKTLK
jgi:uncharacterized membrane protein (UPF0127 family)